MQVAGQQNIFRDIPTAFYCELLGIAVLDGCVHLLRTLFGFLCGGQVVLQLGNLACHLGVTS